MNAICYICNQQSTNFLHRNFTELKSQHTDTPICDFIQTLLADFDSMRNIYDDANHICTECLSQIDDYDWMKQQTIEQEAKLRHVLLSTELKLKSIKSTPIKNENGFEDDSHNGWVFAKELENADIEFEPSTDVAEMLMEQSTLPECSTTTGTMLQNTSIRMPALQSNCRRTFVTITKAKDAALQNDKNVLVSTAMASSLTTPHHYKIINGTRAPEFPKPTLSYACLIGMALKNSRTGSLFVSEICRFMYEHFPFFRTATSDWKRSIRNALSSSNSFVKTDIHTSKGDIRTKFLWSMNASYAVNMDAEIQKWTNIYRMTIRYAMAIPENLPALIRGEMKHGSLKDNLVGLDGTAVSDSDSETIDPVINSEESVQTVGSDVFDEIIIEDSKAFQFEVDAEPCHVESNDSDLQPIRKRPRYDIDLPPVAAPMPIFKTTAAASAASNQQPTKHSKPAFTYSCLITLALKNSQSGSLMVSEIYDFISEHFPYYQTATEDWRRSVRNFLSTNECFKRMECQTIDGILSKKWLWTLHSSEMPKMDEKIRKWSKFTDSNSMAVPENLPAMMRGELKHGGQYELQPQCNEFKEAEPKYPKPAFDNACLIALALKNSWTGSLVVSEIFHFINEHFPYYKTAASKVWKTSVQNILRSNKHFRKVEHKRIIDGAFNTKYLWELNPLKINELNAKLELQKCKNEMSIHNAMADPENLSALLRGEIKHGSVNENFNELNDIVDEFEFENETIDSIIGSEENVQAEFFSEASEMFDEINVDDLDLSQYIQTDVKEDGQSKFHDNDLQSMEKRAFDIGMCTEAAGVV